MTKLKDLPILSAVPGVEKTPIKFGSPSFPVFGYDLKLMRESDGAEAGSDEPGLRRSESWSARR